MNTPQTATLLIGSAKPIGDSTSEALGGYLMQRLADYGLTGETHHVARAMRSEARTAGLLAAVDRSDLFVLAFPLYVDSLPYLNSSGNGAHRRASSGAGKRAPGALCRHRQLRLPRSASQRHRVGDLSSVCRRGRP